MENNAKNDVIEKVNELIEAPSCCPEAKAAAQSWLDSIGTDEEAAKAKALIAELEQDIMPVEELLAFSGSDEAAKVFGAEMAAQVHAHAKELKDAGASYCDCPACAAVAQILEKKDAIL